MTKRRFFSYGYKCVSCTDKFNPKANGPARKFNLHLPDRGLAARQISMSSALRGLAAFAPGANKT